MNDTVQRTAAPQTLSPATRLFDGAIARIEQCGCDGSVVTILRGFDARSRSMARTIRDRLRSRGVRARVLQASVAASPGHLAGLTDDDPLVGHSCAFVDVTAAASSEAERLAGWFDAPLVSLAGTGASSTESQPLLKLRMHVAHAPDQVAFPSAAGVEAAVAFVAVRIDPNQPEQGILQLEVPHALPQQLDPGSSLELRPLGDRMRVTSQGPGLQRRTWFADEVVVSQYSGVHVVERDAMPVADLGRMLTVKYHPRALVHHRV